jgi:predicted adenylyl cyclase CyaB
MLMTKNLVYSLFPSGSIFPVLSVLISKKEYFPVCLICIPNLEYNKTTRNHSPQSSGMAFINIEIKARTSKPDFIRRYLIENGAEFKGVDMQTDTYFNVHKGRLKLREGNIENNLIHYNRNDQPGPKQSDFSLMPVEHPALLKEILSASLGVKVIVKKKREIFYIDNVKFHIDFVDELGHFAEIEASNKTSNITIEKLQQQCHFYLSAFNINEEDLIDRSYSDMLLE